MHKELALAGVKVFVYGSAYQKGTSIQAGGTLGAASAPRVSVDPAFTQFSNSPIILRDQYVINGSDMAQIGWVEVATEDGTSGYLWYLKAESETRLRFEDYLEMSMVESELNTNAERLLELLLLFYQDLKGYLLLFKLEVMCK